MGVSASRRSLGLAVVSWLVGGLSVLLAYSPLWEKHVSYVMPPLAILAGVGLASLAPVVGLMLPSSPTLVANLAASGTVGVRQRTWLVLILAGLSALAVVLIGVSAPAIAAA